MDKRCVLCEVGILFRSLLDFRGLKCTSLRHWFPDSRVCCKKHWYWWSKSAQTVTAVTYIRLLLPGSSNPPAPSLEHQVVPWKHTRPLPHIQAGSYSYVACPLTSWRPLPACLCFCPCVCCVGRNPVCWGTRPVNTNSFNCPFFSIGIPFVDVYKESLKLIHNFNVLQTASAFRLKRYKYVQDKFCFGV